jgi:hypothetical protein
MTVEQEECQTLKTVGTISPICVSMDITWHSWNLKKR